MQTFISSRPFQKCLFNSWIGGGVFCILTCNSSQFSLLDDNISINLLDLLKKNTIFSPDVAKKPFLGQNIHSLKFAISHPIYTSYRQLTIWRTWWLTQSLPGAAIGFISDCFIVRRLCSREQYCAQGKTTHTSYDCYARARKARRACEESVDVSLNGFQERLARKLKRITVPFHCDNRR